MKLTLQWHITEECNYRCKHCYHDNLFEKGPSLEELKNIFYQFLDIKKNHFGVIFSSKKINFIGGEPFIREDFLDLLKFINETIDFKLKIVIITNGSLLTQEKLEFIKSLKNLKVKFFISIEGTEKINDEIRGKGSFKKIISAIELCKKNNFQICLQLTLSKLNYKEVPFLIPIMKKYNVSLRIRRFIPIGAGKYLGKENMLSRENWYKFTIEIYKLNFYMEKKSKFYLDGCSETTGYKYDGEGCPINLHRMIIVYHNLDFYPCIKLGISIGNLKNNSLKELFFSEKYIEMLYIHNKIDVCKECNLFNSCKGGAKCITYAYYGTLEKSDPQCVRAKKILLKKSLC